MAATSFALPAGPAAKLLSRFKAMQAELQGLRSELQHQPSVPIQQQPSVPAAASSARPCSVDATSLLARFEALQSDSCVTSPTSSQALGSLCLSTACPSDDSSAADTLMGKIRLLMLENSELKAISDQSKAKLDSGFSGGAVSSSAPPPTLASFGSKASEEFRQQLATSGIEASPSALESAFELVQRKRARLLQSPTGLKLRYDVVRLYLLANIAGEEKCLIEHDRFDGKGKQQTRMLPPETRLEEGENWRQALARGLQVMVGLDLAWQESHLQITQDSYYCYEELQCDDHTLDGLPVSVQVHEVHARVRGMPNPVLGSDESETFERIGMTTGRDFVWMESSQDGAARQAMHVWCWRSREYERNGKLKSFAKYLAAGGVDVSLFGTDDNKTLFQFYLEAKEKQLCILRESAVTLGRAGPTIERVVEIVKIRVVAEIHNRMRVLNQTDEYLEDGRKRKANQLVIKKVREGDDWQIAAEKAIHERLGIPIETQLACFSRADDKMTCTEEVQPSIGYAGILSHYKIRTITMYVTDPDHPDLACIGLPRGNDFVSRVQNEKATEIKVWTWSLAQEENAETLFGGTGLEELSKDLHDVEALVLQASTHPQAATLGLDTALHQAVQKIKKCVESLSDIDTTLGKVDLANLEDMDPRESSKVANSNLRDFIQANFTKTTESSGDRVATAESDGTVSPQKSVQDMNPADELPGVLGNVEIKQRIKAGVSNWGFDLFDLSQQSDNKVLETYGEVTLVPLAVKALRLGKAASKPRAFLRETSQNYFQNPYHNAMHATQVCHLGVWLNTALGVTAAQTDLEKVSFVLAAICHDIKHIGRNNAFCINTEHALALRYNNQKVLENMHAATAFELLQQTQMLDGLSRSDRLMLRAHIVEYILATDMAEHFETMSKFRVRCESSECGVENEADRRFIARMCLKAGDIGHASLPWDLHKQWSRRVSQEFYAQGDEERQLGLPISALCDRASVPDLAKSQKGFLEFVAMPLFQLLSDFQTQALTKMNQLKVAAEDGVEHEGDSDLSPPNAVGKGASMNPSSPAVLTGHSLRRRSSAAHVAGAHYVQSVCVATIQANVALWQQDDSGVKEIQDFLLHEGSSQE